MDGTPLLLLDVYGVLCPLGPGPGEPLVEVSPEFHFIQFARGLPRRLARLKPHFSLVWATSWEHAANEILSPVLGLARLPVIRFDQQAGPGGTLKLPAVQRFVGDRPFAWVDDRIGPDVLTWARSRCAPTLVLKVHAATGLTDEHVEELLAFAADGYA